MLQNHFLNLHWFHDLEDARRTLEDLHLHYNDARPNQPRGGQLPAVFASEVAWYYVTSNITRGTDSGIQSYYLETQFTAGECLTRVLDTLLQTKS